MSRILLEKQAIESGRADAVQTRLIASLQTAGTEVQRHREKQISVSSRLCVIKCKDDEYKN
jgi:hypothetical protein